MFSILPLKLILMLYLAYQISYKYTTWSIFMENVSQRADCSSPSSFNRHRPINVSHDLCKEDKMSPLNDSREFNVITGRLMGRYEGCSKSLWPDHEV